MPEGLPAQYWDAQGSQVKMGDLLKAHTELSTFKTQHDERIASLPKAAADYKIEFKLPDTVKLPDGVTVEIDEKDPRVAAVRELAHKHQIPQAVFNEIIAIGAMAEAQGYVASDAAIQAEMKKLGENGPERVKAAEAYLKSSVSKEEYESMRAFIGDATAFAGLEKLIQKATAQSVPRHDGTNPTPEPVAKKRPADIFYGSEQRAN